MVANGSDTMRRSRRVAILAAGLLSTCAGFALAEPAGRVGQARPDRPRAVPGGFALPNGWRITPTGQSVADLNDLVLKLLPSPDSRVIAAVHSGFLPHGISLIDARTRRVTQELPLKSTWLGLDWSPDGRTLYVSGGNANGEKKIAASVAPIYAFSYRDGRLDPTPVRTFTDPTLAKDKV